MVIGVLIFLACLSAVFGIIAVHEFGHYVAGVVGGIPRAHLKIRLLTFPQHVAIRSGERWLSPTTDYERYVSASKPLLRDRKRAIAFVAAGLATQTVAFVVLLFGLARAGVPRFWMVPLASALVSVPLLYLCADLVFTAWAQKPCGDFSSLWRISPLASLAVTTLVIAVHLFVLFRVLHHG